jgi:hypothetical protein
MTIFQNKIVDSLPNLTMPSSVRRTFPAGSESEFKVLSDTP